jgi:hypothetical protein
MVSLHDEELEAGADATLLKHLGFLMSRVEIQSKDMEVSLMHEIGCTYEALEMVYRASPQSVLQSFNRIGLELLATLIHLINKQLSHRAADLNQRVHSRRMSECTDENEGELDDANSLDAEGESRPVTPPSCCTYEALEMVYRASPQSVLQSFNRIGLELLATLIHLINKQLFHRAFERLSFRSL